jgi:hypothetical protein
MPRLLTAFALALALAAGAHAGPYCHQTVSAPYYHPTYVAPTVHVVQEVEFSFASPVFNQVDVVELRQRQVYIPTVVTGQSITQTEVVTIDRVLAEVQHYQPAAKRVVNVYRKSGY